LTTLALQKPAGGKLQPLVSRRNSRLSRTVINELDKEDEPTSAVLSDLEKFSDRVEPGPLREARRNLIAPDATK